MSFSDAPAIGSGEFVYECHHNRGQDALPTGLIYISHNENLGSIFVFDDEGRFVKSMGELRNAGPFAKGHGVTIR